MNNYLNRSRTCIYLLLMYRCSSFYMFNYKDTNGHFLKPNSCFIFRNDVLWRLILWVQHLTLPSMFILVTLTIVKQNVSKFSFSVTTANNLRNKNNLTIPNTLHFLQNTLNLNGVKLYNSLPLPFRLKSSIQHTEIQK